MQEKLVLSICEDKAPKKIPKQTKVERNRHKGSKMQGNGQKWTKMARNC